MTSIVVHSSKISRRITSMTSIVVLVVLGQSQCMFHESVMYIK